MEIIIKISESKEINWRHELHPYGVDVIEIAPGLFETEMHNREKFVESSNTVWYRASQELRDEYGLDYNEKGIAFITGIS